MRRHHNKKGQIVLKPASEIIIAVIIVLIWISAGRSYGEGDVFNKVKNANEITVSYDAFKALPSEAYMFIDTSKYDTDIGKNSIKISAFENDPIEAVRHFASNEYMEDVGKFEKPGKVVITRNNAYKADGWKIQDLKKCPSADTARPGKTIIMPKTLEQEIYTFSDIIKLQLSGFGPELQDTVSVTEKQPFIIAIVRVESDDVMMYHLPNVKSRRAACLMEKNIREEYPDLEVELALSDKYPLSGAYVGVSIELNKELENTNTAVALADAMREY